MLLVSIVLFMAEFYCISLLKGVSNSGLSIGNEPLEQLIDAIRSTDINHYITYFMIYASFIYLGIHYNFLLYVMLSMQVVSVSVMIFLLNQVNKA